MARTRHPGQKNNLDALCKRYEINNSHRKLHGALLDAEILAEVYLAMTGGQVSLLSLDNTLESHTPATIKRITMPRPPLKIISPTAKELEAHDQQLTMIDKVSNESCLWKILSTRKKEN